MKRFLSLLLVLTLMLGVCCLPVLAQADEAPYEMTIWMPMVHSSFMTTYDDVKCVQLIGEKTGVKVSFIHPTIAQNEAFNIMVASRDYPDAIYYRWSTYPGGLTKAVADGLLIKLDDYKEYMPNLMRVFEENPELKRQALLDDGSLAWFPAATTSYLRRAFNGILIRQDWLDKLGLKMPTTIDELKETLIAFKTQDPNGNGEADEIGLISNQSEVVNTLNLLGGAWGVRDSWQIDPETGKIAYGPVLPAYKEYLKTMHEWYEEGLIDKEFAATDSNMYTAKVTSSQAGIYQGNTATFEQHTRLMEEAVPEVNLQGMPYLIGPAGKDYSSDENRVRLVWGQGVGVTTGCKNIPAVVKFLDYGYSDEGYMAYGWGVEGESYTMENGVPTLTEVITNDPDKLATTQAIVRYAFGNNGFAKLHNIDFWKATELNFRGSKEANALWYEADNGLLLPLLNLTEEEGREVASIMNEVTTYYNEMFMKFIIGTESLDNFDRYVETIKSMGLEQATAIEQAAYDRYASK